MRQFRHHRHRPICRRAAPTILTAALVFALLAGCESMIDESPSIPAEHRPEQWAAAIDAPGLPNLHKVSDDLYRGAQPTKAGIEQLELMGIKTIINLRNFHSDREIIEETPLDYEHIYMKPWHPEEEDVVEFLQIVTDPNRTPVFLHCQRGADRTGTMVAIYRVVVQEWPVNEAVGEMQYGGFNFDENWDNLTEFLEELDVEDLRRQIGQ